MGFVLIWLETLAAALLFEATVAAVSARRAPRWGWRVPPVTVAFLMLVVAAFTSAIAWMIYAYGFAFGQGGTIVGPVDAAVWKATTERAVPASSVFFLVAWTSGFGIGTGWIWWHGLRRRGEPRVPAAATWPRGRLATAWVVAVLLAGITFSILDQAAKVQLASVRQDAGAIALNHAPPRIPDRENAAHVYRRAFEILKPLEQVPEPLQEKTAAWRNYDKSKFDPKDKDLRGYLRAREPGLVLVRKGAAMPGCSFDYNYLDPLKLLLPELQYLRDAARDLALDALVKATDGDTEGALADVAALYGIAGHFTDPLLITLLMAVAVEKTADRALEDVLALTAPLPGELAPLPPESTTSYQMRLHRSLEMEEAFGLTAFGCLGNGDTRWLVDFKVIGDESFMVDNILIPFYRVFLLSDDLAGYRGMMKVYQDVTKYPYYEAPPQWWHQEAKELMSRGGVLTRLLIPATNRSRRAAAEGDTARRLAQVAVALTYYRAAKGTYPQNLDALVPGYLPQVPLDPFDGKPLRYKPDGKGVMVYSSGPGVAEQTQRQPITDNMEGQMVFRLKP